MEKLLTKFGAVAIALAMSGLPAVALAESGNGETQGNAVQVTSVQAEQVQKTSEAAREGQKQRAEVSREQQKNRLEEEKDQSEATSSNDRGGNQIDENQNDDGEINLDLEDDSNPATSFEDLKQKIEKRRGQLEQEVASTTEADKNIVENANPVRLAVHSLLASKELLGGIGQQVSEIAKQMNDSVATTTNAEAKVQARSFITRLLFGGDSAAADVIARQVAQNQSRIDDLNKLLGEANVPADIQTVLKAQITAIQDAQARLQALAQKEQKAWGLFSWRF